MLDSDVVDTAHVKVDSLFHSGFLGNVSINFLEWTFRAAFSVRTSRRKACLRKRFTSATALSALPILLSPNLECLANWRSLQSPGYRKAVPVERSGRVLLGRSSRREVTAGDSIELLARAQNGITVVDILSVDTEQMPQTKSFCVALPN